MAGFKDLILQNLPLPYPDASFAGETVIVTGANIGLGFEAARHFTRLLAAKVILAVRDPAKGAAARTAIETSTGRLGVIECWELDMSTFASTAAFISRARALPRLDVLVLNAGIGVTSWRFSPDGWEDTLQVNVLSTALLALQLLPVLLRSATTTTTTTPGRAPRMVIVSSEVHQWACVTEQIAQWPVLTDGGSVGVLHALNDRARSEKDIQIRYPLSKLFNLYTMREIAKLVPRGGGGGGGGGAGSPPVVVVNALNPGFCKSALGRESGWGLYLMQLAFARSTEKGSRVLVDAASRGEDSHGRYLSSCSVVE